MIDLRALAAETLFSPATAARRILNWNPGREVILAAFTLVLVLGAMLDIVQRQLLPLPEGLEMPSIGPVVFVIVLGGAHIAMAAAMAGIGRWLGGSARFFDLLALLSWLGLLSVGFQVLSLVLLFVMPLVAAILNLAVVAYGFYVMLQFINQAHGFDSLMKSFGVVAMSALAVAFTLLFLSGL